jgi:hypothetical protein
MRTTILLITLLLFPGVQPAESQWIQTGPDNGPVACLASKDTVLLAGTSGGVFISKDRSHTWTHPMSNLWAEEMRCFAIVGTDVYAGHWWGVHRSSDLGNSWISISSGLPSGAVTDLAAVKSWIFAATQGGDMFRSSDRGTTWTLVDVELLGSSVKLLEVIDTVLFAGMSSGDLCRSPDCGVNWVSVTPGWSGCTVTALTAMGRRLCVGTSIGTVFRSSDHGNSWMQISTGFDSDRVTCTASIDNNLLVGTTNGAYRSTDDGGHWTAVSTEVLPGEIYGLHALGEELFAGTISGVYRSTDRGESWTDANTGMKNATVQALALDGSTLYAGTWGGGVFRSTNSGDTWEHFLNTGSAFSFAFTASDLYAGVWGGLCYTPKGSTIQVSLSFSDTLNRVYSLAARDSVVFVGSESGGILRTWHRGTNWWAFSRVGFKGIAVNSLMLDGPTLYAGTRMGVFSSSDAGESWMELNIGLTSLNVQALAVKGTDMFAGTAGGGVFRSTDHGAGWKPATKGLVNTNVMSFAVKDDYVFAGTWEGGVFVSTDNGANWTPVSGDKVPDPTRKVPAVIHGLAVDDAYLYAGERRTGVWRRPLSELVTSVALKAPVGVPGETMLNQNYPNPFNPSTTIRYGLSRRSHVSLAVYNTLGQRVTVLQNGEQEAGYHEATFDASYLPSGVYFYRLQAGSDVETRKLCLVR